MTLIEILKLEHIQPIIFICALILIAALFVAITSKSARKSAKVSRAIAFVATALVVAQIAFTIAMCKTAISHGAMPESLETMHLSEITNRVFNTHATENIDIENTDFANCYIMYFRFTCNDCVETYKPLQEFLKKNPAPGRIYYISTDSETGKSLLGKYGIAEVPGLVYIYPNGRTFLGKTLYYKQEGVDGAVFDGEAILELYQLQAELNAE